jgi:hypothetical protein
MPNIAKEWAERARQGRPARHQGAQRLHGRDAQGRRQAGPRLGQELVPAPRTTSAPSWLHKNRQTKRKPGGAVFPVPPLELVVRRVHARPERRRHAADPGDGGRGQRRRRRPQLFNNPIAGVLEFVGLSIVAIVFLQMANTLREDRHVSNDMFVVSLIAKSRPRLAALHIRFST